MLRIKELYKKEIIEKMIKEFGYKNCMQVPRIEKVVINVGIGECKDNPKLKDIYLNDLTLISGQKPVFTKARKAISGFKIRKNDQVGLKVTLRGKRMFDFIERLTRIVLPRIRDFRGLKITGFDGNGNYNLGIKEHIVFPEIKYDKTEKIFGLQVTIKTNTKSNKEAFALLKYLGFPFEKQKKGLNG